MAENEYYIQDNSNLEDKKLEAAEKLLAEGSYQSALRLYLDIVNTSYSYKVHYDIARCYYRLNDYREAEKYFNQSVSLQNHRNPSFLFLGNICNRDGDIQNAIENWMKYYSFRPDDGNVCLNLATSYFKKDMKFQSDYFYNKYLKYAKDKNSDLYKEIKNSIKECTDYGQKCYKRALADIDKNNYDSAIETLEYAVKNYPTSFDINFLLGKLYYRDKMYNDSIFYLKQAYCTDFKSLDLFKLFLKVLIDDNNYSEAFCCLKRLMPLVLHNQKEYLEIITLLKNMKEKLPDNIQEVFKERASKFYNNNNYYMALYNYENARLVRENPDRETDDIINRLKQYINPEESIIKACIERGGVAYSNGDFKKSNKYFTKVMNLSKEDSSEYRFAKLRITHV